ncbi:MAG: DNRLRE domain-containing protein [bacterium]
MPARASQNAAAWLLLALFISAGPSLAAEATETDGKEAPPAKHPISGPYTVELGRPDGRVVPRIIGASTSSFSSKAPSSIDYLEWSGITHLREWSRFTDPSQRGAEGIGTYEDFKTAVDAIRKEPLRQGTANDVYIDWKQEEEAFRELASAIKVLSPLGIQLLLTNTTMVGGKLSDWKAKFVYWRSWYAYVYYFASKHGVEIYQMANEPDYRWEGKDEEEKAKQWVELFRVASDAMQAAMADVNRDHGTRLKLAVSGPVTAGDKLTSFGKVALDNVHTDLQGKPESGRWNLHHYDYHQYTSSADKNVTSVLSVRKALNAATPDHTIPITLSEVNVITGSKASSKGTDLSDIGRGTSVAAMLQALTTLGNDGLTAEGGFWLFKWGTVLRAGSNLTRSNGNGACYVDTTNPPNNFGGVLLGGAVFQMFATHFSGQKPLLALKEWNAEGMRTMACHDAERRAYSVFGHIPPERGDGPVRIDLSKLETPAGAHATLQLVDQYNVGQITQILKVGEDRILAFQPSGATAWHLHVPAGPVATRLHKTFPVGDTCVTVGSKANHGTDPVLKVSTHHAEQNKRNIALMRFNLPDKKEPDTRVLLSLSGRNAGRDPGKREILHVYLLDDESWDEKTVTWENAPGVGKYPKDGEWLKTDGSGPMVAIEDNYGGVKPGTGLGLCGKFIGQLSFHKGSWQQMHLDVTRALEMNTFKKGKSSATFLIARIVRYDVNKFQESKANDYHLGEYHYDDRLVEIASREHGDEALRPHLLTIDVLE